MSWASKVGAEGEPTTPCGQNSTTSATNESENGHAQSIASNEQEEEQRVFDENVESWLRRAEESVRTDASWEPPELWPNEVCVYARV